MFHIISSNNFLSKSSNKYGFATRKIPATDFTNSMDKVKQKITINLGRDNVRI